MGNNGDKKFLFDLNNFDIDFEEEKKKKPKEPTFSLKDMEEARSAAFEKGKMEGEQVAKDSIEQRVEILVQSIAGNIATLETEEGKRHEKVTQDALVISYNTLKTLIPSLWDKIAEDDLKRFLSDFFSQSRAKSDFALFVHPSMVEAVTPYAQKIHSTIHVYGDEKLSPNASRIEWEQGGATFTPEQTADKIMNLIREQITDSSELLDESTKIQHNEEDKTNTEDVPQS